ncbi:colorectal mutant cancer protein [Aplochiton taeniatus]
MQDFILNQSDSLRVRSSCDMEMTQETTEAEPAIPYSSVSLEPSQAELTQCEAEVGTLLRIIAELNQKMGTLQAPSETEDPKLQEPICLPLPDFQSAGCCPEKDNDYSAETLVNKQGSSGETWTELQGVLSALEDSIRKRRTWANPSTASDQNKQAEHITAARESWVLATQVLQEMEREFGISYPSGLPPEERQQYQRDVLSLHQQNVVLRNTLQSRQVALDGTKYTVSQMDEERNKLQEALLDLQRAWRSASISPPYSPSGSISGGAMSAGWASPLFPGSPLLVRRHMAAFPALSTGGDISPSASFRGSSGCPDSSCPSPIPSIGGSETERLHRCIERLKAKNEHLTAALERRKAESEQISMTLGRHEADNSALQMALRYSEECEEAYSELLSLHEARKQQCIPQWRDQAEPVRENYQANSPILQVRGRRRTEELSTSFSTPGDAIERLPQRLTNLSLRDPELVGRDAALRHKIESLKWERAAVCVPKPGPGGEGKLSPDTGTLAGPRGGQRVKEGSNMNREKSALLYELVTVRDEMSELRGLIRLTEKERRCLDWSLMAQKAQDAAGALISQSLSEELEERRSQQQRLAENVAKLCSEGDTPGPQNQTILRELQDVLQREQVLRRRLATVRDSLDLALSDSASRRRDSEQQVVRLAQAHSKATGSYRNARKKCREQLWRLERQVTAMSERHTAQIDALKATLEVLEWQREETIL